MEWERAGPSARVLEQGSTHHAIALEQLADALVERAPGDESGPTQPFAGDDVIALVGILADGAEVDVERRHVFLDLEGQLFLGEVGGVQADIVGLADHVISMPDTEYQAVRDIANVDVVAL